MIHWLVRRWKDRVRRWKDRQARLEHEALMRIEAKLQLSRTHCSGVITPELIEACVTAYWDEKISMAREKRSRELQ